MSIIFKTDEGKVISISLEKLSKPIYGSQSRIYFYDSFVIKVFPLDEKTESISLRFREIKKKCHLINPKVIKQVIFRGIPLATSIDFKNYFDFKTTDKALVLLFNYLEGRDLFEYLKDEPPLSSNRKNIYFQLADLLISMKSKGIMLSDLYPDNFIVNNEGQVYVLNMESCGIVDANNEWILKPMIVEKDAFFLLPPEVKFRNEFTTYSYVWTATYLLFFILTGIKPLDFLTRNDHNYLQSIIPYCDRSDVTWPPKMQFIKDQKKYQYFKELYHSLFTKDCLSRVLLQTYINGYQVYNSRPSFEDILNALDKELDYNQNLTIHKTSSINQKIEKKYDNTDIDELENKINLLPISTREYLRKIISYLKHNQMYDDGIKNTIYRIIESKQIDFLVNSYIKTGDISLIYVFFLFFQKNYWDSFINIAYKLSSLSGKSVYRIVESTILPIVKNYRVKKIDENIDEIFKQIQAILYKKIAEYQQKKEFKLDQKILIIFSLVYFTIPMLLYYLLRIEYVFIIALYPFLFTFTILLYNFVLTKK